MRAHEKKKQDRRIWKHNMRQGLCNDASGHWVAPNRAPLSASTASMYFAGARK